MKIIINNQVIFSNQLEILADTLRDQLFTAHSLPFEKRHVIVPNDHLKTYLLHRFARDAKLNIGAGLQIDTLPRALKDFAIPSFLELSLRLEGEISLLLKEGNKEGFEPLFEYLQGDPAKIEKRLSSLCSELSSIFSLYSTYGASELKGWQRKLWEKIKPDNLLNESVGIKAHLFAFNFLPRLYFDFFKNADSVFYVLSPCKIFWEDFYTSHEKTTLQKKIRTAGIKEKEREDWEGYLKENNLFLSNMGKLHRAFLPYLEDLPSEENYKEPRCKTLLHQLQKNLLSGAAKTAFEKDNSIQVHLCTTKWKEVERLRDIILKSKLEPKHVLVLSPNLKDYVPYIHMLFDGVLDYALFNLELKSQSPFLTAFDDLLALSEKRFESSAVCKLFTHGCFGVKKFDTPLLRKWIKQTGLLWGIDAQYRDRVLGQKMLEENETGTWEATWEKLLNGLIYDEALVPVEWSEAELLGEWISLLENLYADLLSLEEGVLNMEEWMEKFKEISRKYFSVAEEELSIFQAPPGLEAYTFKFSTAKRVLSHLFQKKTASFHASHLNAVRFFQYTEGAVQPAEMVCLLGAKSTHEQKSALCELNYRARENFCPTQAEIDRSLFLDTILSARKYLIFTYQEETPSLLVQELMSYLDIKETVQKENDSVKSEIKPFFPEFYTLTPLKPIQEDLSVISLRQLSKFAKNPIRFYMQNVLGMTYDQDAKDNEEFTLSPLQRALLRKEEDRVFQMPLGVFKEVALTEVKKDQAAYQKNLEALNICKEEDIYSIEFKLSCRSPVRLESGNWIVPALKVGNTHIVGVLDEVTDQGLVVHKKDQLQDVLEVWPSLLVLNQYRGASDLFLTKCGKGKTFAISEQALSSYLEYFALALSNVSPMMPAWGKAILTGTPEDLEKAMEAQWFLDPYLQWLFARDPTPNANVIMETWQDTLKKVFSNALL